MTATLAAPTRTAQLEALQRVGAALASAATPEDVARAVIHEARAATNARTAAMWSVEDGALVLLREIGWTDGLRAAYARVSLSDDVPVAECVRRREPLWFDSRDAFRAAYPDAEATTRRTDDGRELAFVCMPLVVEGAALGALSFVFDPGRTLDGEDRRCLWMLGRQAAQATARARAYARERRARVLVQQLQVATAALSQAATAQEVARVVVDQAVESFGAAVGGVWLLDADARTLRAVYDRGVPEEHASFRSFSVDADLPVAAAVRTGRPSWFPDLDAYERAHPGIAALARAAGRAQYAVATFPLADDRAGASSIVFGALALSFADRVPHDDERDTFAALAQQTAGALLRARALESARREERRFRTLVVASAQVVFTADPAGRPADDGATWCAFTGQSAEDFRAGRTFEAVHEDDRERVRRAWEEAVAGARVFETQHRLRRSDGTYVPVVARATPVLDENGVVQEWIGTVTDVGAREAALRARERSADRLRIVQQVTAELSRAVTPAEIGAVFLNHAVAAFGAAAGTVSTTSSDGALVLAASAGLSRFEAEALARPSVDAPLPVCAAVRDGAPIWLSSAEECRRAFPAVLALDAGRLNALAALPLATARGTIGALTLRFPSTRAFDEEERDQLGALAALVAQAVERARVYDAERRSNEHLRILAQASARLSSTLDYERTLHNVVELVVPALADFAFFDVVEADGQVRRVARADDPAKQAVLDGSRWARSERTDLNLCALSTGRVGLHGRIDDAFRRRMAASPAHLEVLRRLELSAMLTVPFEVRGALAGALTLCMGESRRVYDEADVGTVLDLSQRAAMAVDNARLLQESRDAVRVRDDFLAIAGHELNTPIATLKVQLHGFRSASELSERSRARVDVVERQADRLAKLVAQLLDVSRIGAGRLVLEPEPVDLAEVVRDVVHRCEDDRARVGSALELQLTSVVGNWDRLRLDQVATNLIANALKYGRGRPVRVAVEQVEGRARLVVEDQGIGIAPDRVARLFQRFERAVSRDYGGFGLGLWIARQIVEASGGDVRVHSVPDVGSAFVVELPVAGAGAARVPMVPR